MTATQQHQLVLDACRPAPLASYLKALGVLRLLGEQRSAWQVRGAWQADRFVMQSPMFSGVDAIDRRKLQAFFLDEYRPSPIVSPWNGGSGFYLQEGKLNTVDPLTGKKIKTGVRNQPTVATRTVDRLLASRTQRLDEYRLVLQLAKEVVAEFGYQEAPKEEEKRDLIQRFRGLLPETAVVALDASLALGDEKPSYAPLLGTGWNDGNLDFSNNFMQRVADVLDVDSGAKAQEAGPWLSAALFGVATPGLLNASIGQFSPGGVGGPNATVGFEADSIVNPWDFVLMLEGALLFAVASTRRLEASQPGALGYPFTVRASGSGNGSVGAGDESQVRAEIWLPLWKGFASSIEIRTLLAEGRVTLGRKRARDGLGFVRAVAALGVDRGISSFQRFGFLKRSGKAYLATPLSQVVVRRNPDADLIDDLESGQFLDRLRRFARNDQAPISIRSQVHQLEDALFEFAQRAEARSLQKVLSVVGSLSLMLGKSPKCQEQVPPVPSLSEAWALKADDGSSEFRTAAAMAGLDGGLPVRPFITPVAQDRHRWVWDPDSRIAVWSEGDFSSNVTRLIARRRLEAERIASGRSPFQHQAGVSSGDVAAWLAGRVDERRVSSLFLGLTNVSIPQHLPSRGGSADLPAAHNVLKPFFTPVGLLIHLELIPAGKPISLPGELLTRLQAGRVQDAVDWAWRRLRAIGFPLPAHPKAAPSAPNCDGRRLLTALAMPVNSSDLSRCLSTVAQRHPPASFE